jgi:hypothetical protein
MTCGTQRNERTNGGAANAMTFKSGLGLGLGSKSLAALEYAAQQRAAFIV